MRWAVGLLAVFALVGLVALTRPEKPAEPDEIEAIVPIDSGLKEPVSGLPTVTQGVLPDGTSFVVTVVPGVPDDWLGSSAHVVLDLSGFTLSADELSTLPTDSRGLMRAQAVPVRLRIEARPGQSSQNGPYRILAGVGTGSADSDIPALEVLGLEAEKLIRQSIVVDTAFGLPFLHLNQSLRWAGDEEGPPMSVRFSAFEVKKGCTESSAVCARDGSLQVVWRAGEFASAPPIKQPKVMIEALE